MKIKRILLLSLLRWLNAQGLKGIHSRKRTNFISKYRDEINNTENFRTNLVALKAKKDEQGNFVVLTDELGRKNYDISEEDQKAIATQLEQYLHTEIDIPTSGKENKTLVEFIANLVSKTNYEFKGKEADDYNEWMNIFEEYFH